MTVDPWAMQEKLMQISDQALPSTPQINRTSVMYVALNMEELSELAEAVAKALAPHTIGASGLEFIVQELCINAKEMLIASKSIRNALAQLPNFSLPLKPHQAKDIADGTTDLTVTNCGFALSSGLPPQDCYHEVASSNLSKANPDTGFIDKTPDGKWIKGVAYKEPDIVGVLERVAAERAPALDPHQPLL